MGLVVKPRKCRSLSLIKGIEKKVHFQIKDRKENTITNILSVLEKPMKFLGSEIAHLHNEQQNGEFLLMKLTEKLDNIDNPRAYATFVQKHRRNPIFGTEVQYDHIKRLA